jgi:FtsZ-interacting cell division protein ZipA
MAKLVLLVVAAAWAAVLIPPMLRSRVDNRPNSSVTDFRRQLNRLQSTSTPPRGSVRGAMGRPLAQSSSPLQRQAAAGRPGQAAPTRQASTRQASAQQGSVRSGGTAVRDQTSETTRYRSHGDPSGGQSRPEQANARRRPSEPKARRAPQQRNEPQPKRRQPDRTGAHRRSEPVQSLDPAALVRRRRTNVLFILVVTAASTMFLAATTDSRAMLWAFGLSFVATCGYVYVLAQLRGREQAGWNTDGWLEQR